MDISTWLAFAAIPVLLIISALLSGFETALTAASRARLQQMSDTGNQRAALALRLLERPDRLLGALLIGNNLVNILAASLATYTLVNIFGESGVLIATFGLTALIVVLAEITPKTFAIGHPERVAIRASMPVHWLVRLFGPILPLARVLTRAVLAALRLPLAPDTPIFATDDEIRSAIHFGRRRGAFAKEDSDVLVAALELRNSDVSDVMTNRHDVEMINADDDFETQLEKCLQYSHTRLPVWRESRETIVGVVHAKDMFRRAHEIRRRGDQSAQVKLDIMEIAKPPVFVLESRSLADQFREFQRRNRQLALVVDEYGVFLGVVTLEDIVEDVFGEIRDEHDPVIESIKPEGANSYRLKGLVTIRDFNRFSDSDLPDEEATTVAGFVIHMAKQIPEPGSEFEFNGFRFRVEQRDNNRLTELLVTRLLPTGHPPEADT